MTRIANAADRRAPSLKSSSLLMAVVGSAIGLNLSVLSIGPLVPLAGGSDDAAEAAATAAPTTDAIPSVLAAVAPEADEALPAANALPISGTAAAPPAPAPAGLPPAVPAGTAPPATPAESTVPRPTGAPTTAPPTTTAPSTTLPTTPSTIVTQRLRYTIEGIGVVVVLYHQGQALDYDSAELVPGWEVDVETDSAARIELKFKNVTGGEDEAKWTLTRRNGQLNEQLER